MIPSADQFQNLLFFILTSELIMTASRKTCNTETNSPAKCPHYALSFRDLCVLFIKGAKTWDGAKEFCQYYNMNLIEPETMKRAEAFHGLAKYARMKTYWIGITHDEEKNAFVWASHRSKVDKDLLLRFPIGQPNNKNCIFGNAYLDFKWSVKNCLETSQFICSSVLLKYPDRPDVLKFNQSLSRLEEGSTLEVKCGAYLSKRMNIWLIVLKNVTRTRTLQFNKFDYNENTTKDRDGICQIWTTARISLPLRYNMTGIRIACTTHLKWDDIYRCTTRDVFCTSTDPIEVKEIAPDRPEVVIVVGDLAALEEGSSLVVNCSAHLRERDELRFALIYDDKSKIIPSSDIGFVYSESPAVRQGLNPLFKRHGHAQLSLTMTPGMLGRELACVSNVNERVPLCSHLDKACTVVGILTFGLDIPPWMVISIRLVLSMILLVILLLLWRIIKGEHKSTYDMAPESEDWQTLRKRRTGKFTRSSSASRRLSSNVDEMTSSGETPTSDDSQETGRWPR